MKTIVTGNPAAGQQFLLLPTNRGIEFVDTSTVIRIEAISNYSKIYFNNGKTLVLAKVLRWFEERLSLPAVAGQTHAGASGDFIRVHRTHLINKRFIECYRWGKIRLSDGGSIDVAKRKKSFFLKWWMGEYCIPGAGQRVMVLGNTA